MQLLETDRSLVTARRKNTSIDLWFEGDLLEAHRVAWTYPITNYGARFKTNICTGQRFVDLRLLGPRGLAGASVLLDNEKVGEMSSAGTQSLDVPLGVHRLTIEKHGLGPWTRELTYDDSSSAYDRLEVDLDVP